MSSHRPAAHYPGAAVSDIVLETQKMYALLSRQENEMPQSRAGSAWSKREA